MARAGEDIDSYCGKCRLLLAHVVIATQAERAVRVQCKTCNSPHNHREPKAERTPRAASAARTRTPGTSRGQAGRFAEAIEGRDISRAKRYTPALGLAVGDVLDHSRFGLGVVCRLSGDNKALVSFRDAERTLICTRSHA